MATIQPLIKAIAYKRSAFMWMAAVCIALSRWRSPCVMRSVGLTAHEWRAGVVSLLLQQSRKGPRQSYSPRRKRCPVRCGWRLWKPTAIASACWHSMRLTACLNGSQLMMCLHNFWNSHHFRVMMLNAIASFFVSWSWVTLLVCLLHRLLKWGRVSRVGDPALIYLPFICRVYTGSLVFTALARIITAILQINEGVMGKNEVN